MDLRHLLSRLYKRILPSHWRSTAQGAILDVNSYCCHLMKLSSLFQLWALHSRQPWWRVSFWELYRRCSFELSVFVLLRVFKNVREPFLLFFFTFPHALTLPSSKLFSGQTMRQANQIVGYFLVFAQLLRRFLHLNSRPMSPVESSGR